MTKDELAAAVDRMRRYRQWEHNHYEPVRDNPYISAPDANVSDDRGLIVDAYLNPAPIDMVLPCPRCGNLHIDRPDQDDGEWKNPPHKSHLCRVEDGGCGLTWRPADVPTNGVAAVKTKGEKDSPLDDDISATWEWMCSLPGRIIDPASTDSILLQIDGQSCLVIEHDGSVAIQQGMFSDLDCQYIALPFMIASRGDLRRIVQAIKSATRARPVPRSAKATN